MIDPNDLEKKAEAATPGPWCTTHIFHGEEVLFQDVDAENQPVLGHLVSQADAEFIAAANPSVVLELIKELEEAREEIKFLKAYKQ